MTDGVTKVYPEHLQKYIPPNFDLAKYDKAANMDLMQWIANLEERHNYFVRYLDDNLTFDKNIEDIFSQIENRNGPIKGDAYDHAENGKEALEKSILQTIKSGIVSGSSFESLLKTACIGDGTKNASIVNGMTYEDLFLMRDSYITQELEELHSKIKPSLIPSFRERNLGIFNNEIHSFDYDGQLNLSWLKIDMNCSDGEITEAFSTWLKETRAERETKTKRRERRLKHFNRVAFRKWHDAKVLPYIDLVTWNFLQKNKLTSKIIGDILFPDPKDLSDSTAIINDTVKPLAIKLESKVTLRRMMAVFANKTRKKIT